jgi:hypothetical protein
LALDSTDGHNIERERLTMNKQRFCETTTFDEICIYDMDAFDVARALRRDGINREDREQVMSYLGPLASETWIRVCMADWHFSSYGLGVEGRVSSDVPLQDLEAHQTATNGS